LYWKKASRLGAILAMVIGMITYLVCDELEFEIQSHIYGLLASIFAMILGSFLFPDKTPKTDELS
jgi:Na+/pantothenate symporter